MKLKFSTGIKLRSSFDKLRMNGLGYLVMFYFILRFAGGLLDFKERDKDYPELKGGAEFFSEHLEHQSDCPVPIKFDLHISNNIKSFQ